MLIKVVAGILFVMIVWGFFRLAMGLRWAKIEREDHRRDEEARGRRVVAEIPLSEGELLMLLEDADAFHWGTRSVAKADIVGGRLLLNGGIIGEFAASGTSLPAPARAEEYEGRERWDVRIYRRDAEPVEIPCGTLREGVSREIAGRAFDAVRGAVGAAMPTR
jgi:hypothetical protein